MEELPRRKRSALAVMVRRMGFARAVVPIVMAAIASMIVTAELRYLTRAFERGTFSVSTFVVLAGTMALIVATIALNHLYLRQVRTFAQDPINPHEELPDEKYVLYLRPFDQDLKLFTTDPAISRTRGIALERFFGYGDLESIGTWEERVVQTFKRFGSVVAVGGLNETRPLPGAHRFYLPVDNWQSTVAKLSGNNTLLRGSHDR
ncbi:hypothetical protein AB0I84_49420 [Streptomyces spectabilis]|uniref:hypothetical protein n=1 Tax=Streptomyces spectabilis TaxID=68270 RepID=UPI0033D96A69